MVCRRITSHLQARDLPSWQNEVEIRDTILQKILRLEH